MEVISLSCWESRKRSEKRRRSQFGRGRKSSEAMTRTHLLPPPFREFYELPSSLQDLIFAPVSVAFPSKSCIVGIYLSESIRELETVGCSSVDLCDVRVLADDNLCSKRRDQRKGQQVLKSRIHVC